MNEYAASKIGGNNSWAVKKVTQLRPSSERILLVCEDEKSITDGLFHPEPQAFLDAQTDPTKKYDAVASRHRLKRNEKATQMRDTFGNVAFSDGHGEFMSRKDALRQKYTGHPVADPVGF